MTEGIWWAGRRELNPHDGSRRPVSPPTMEEKTGHKGAVKVKFMPVVNIQK